VPRFEHDESAKTVADDERTRPKFGGLTYRPYFLCESSAGVTMTPAAVAVTGQIQCDDTKLIRKKWCDEAPPFQVCIAAVNERDSGATAPAPDSIHDRYSGYIDRSRFAGRGQRAQKPGGSLR